jgi:hypothetical protein
LALSPIATYIHAMPTTLPIERMTRAEKLRAMEELWADLSRDAERVPLPDWHKATFAERERLVRAGKARFQDWESAKKRIARRVA